MIKKILSLLSFCFMTVSFVYAQTGGIEGTITNAKTGEPVIGANIFLMEVNRGAATNARGEYTIADVPVGTYTLRVTFVGYTTSKQQVTISVGETTEVNIKLQAATVGLQELVVTALGIERKEESLGTSTQTVDAEELAASPAVGVVNKLAGKTSGLRIVSSSGQPGSAPRIVIRGANSITGNNQPLFVVNGVPISNSSSDNPSSSLYYGSGSSRALDIDPSIIESVTVLKGGAATALYGARAANGAILIETKSGYEGSIRINFNSSVRFDKTITQGTQDEYLSGQYGCFTNGLPLDKGGYAAPCYPGSDPTTDLSWGPRKGEVSPQVLNALGVESIETYNQLDRFYQLGVYRKNSLNISGGNETATFFISGSRLHQKGTVPTTSLARTNFNLKVSKQLLSSGDLVSNTSVSYINTKNDRMSNGYYSTARSIRLWPINLKMKPYLYNDGTIRSLNSITNSPFWRVNNTGFNTDVNRLILKQSLVYELTPWMSVSEVFGLDRYDTEQLVYRNRRKQIVNDGSMVNRKILNSILNNYVKVNIEEINITPDFAFSANLGNNIEIQKYNSTTVSADDQVIPGFFDESNFTTVDGDKYLSERRKFSFYGQLILNYGDYLFLTLSGRNDWSSTLPKSNRSYFYSSASLAFTFSDLLGLDTNSLFSFGKIRASIANTGSDAPLYSLATNYYAPTFGGNIHEVNFGLEFPYNSISGFVQSSTLGNPNLKPERTRSYEAGVDLRFINSRIGLHATYYTSSTRDLIYSTTVAPSTGFSSKLRNAGEIRNRGFNITLEGTPVSTNNFNWTLQANWSKNVSEVVSLAPGVNQLYLAGFSFPSIQATVGEGYGSIIGYAYERNENGQLIIQDDPDNANYGYPIVADRQQVIGNIQPDWTGNLSTTFRYKGFSLSALFAFQQGGDILNFSLNYTISAGMAEITETRGTQMTDPGEKGYVKPYSWPGVKASNGEPNDIKVLRNQDFWNQYAVVHENQVEDASYIKLSQLSLGYSLPATILENTPIREASFTVTGRNLWIMSDFSYGDPAGSVYGSSNGGTGYYLFITPSSRSIMFSLQLGF